MSAWSHRPTSNADVAISKDFHRLARNVRAYILVMCPTSLSNAALWDCYNLSELVPANLFHVDDMKGSHSSLYEGLLEISFLIHFCGIFVVLLRRHNYDYSPLALELVDSFNDIKQQSPSSFTGLIQSRFDVLQVLICGHLFPASYYNVYRTFLMKSCTIKFTIFLLI
jgi:hypothetical protein